MFATLTLIKSNNDPIVASSAALNKVSGKDYKYFMAVDYDRSKLSKQESQHNIQKYAFSCCSSLST